VVDVPLLDEQGGGDDGDALEDGEVEDAFVGDEPADEDGHHGGQHVARVVEALVAADASGQALVPDHPERDGRHAGRKDGLDDPQGDLRRGDGKQLGEEDDRQAGERDNGRRDDEHEPLAARVVDEATHGGLREDGDEPGDRHHHPDAGGIPLLLGQQVDGQIDAHPVLHVRHEDVDEIEPAQAAC
jgi:hypothetical protein